MSSSLAAYGGRDRVTDDSRYFQGLIFAQDKRSNNPDSNFYAYPIPIIPIMDYHKREIVRIDKLDHEAERVIP